MQPGVVSYHVFTQYLVLLHTFLSFLLFPPAEHARAVLLQQPHLSKQCLYRTAMFVAPMYQQVLFADVVILWVRT